MPEGMPEGVPEGGAARAGSGRGAPEQVAHTSGLRQTASPGLFTSSPPPNRRPALLPSRPHTQDSPEAGTKGEVAALLLQLLRQKAALLRDCFGVGVDAGAAGWGWRVAGVCGWGCVAGGVPSGVVGAVWGGCDKPSAMCVSSFCLSSSDHTCPCPSAYFLPTIRHWITPPTSPRNHPPPTAHRSHPPQPLPLPPLRRRLPELAATADRGVHARPG